MTTTAKHKALWLSAALVGGVMAARAVYYFYGNFSNTYATLLSAAVMGPFLLLIVGNTKFALWGLLTLCLPITIDVTLGSPEAHISGASGYIVSLFDIVLFFLYLLWISEMAFSKRIDVHFFPEISIPAIALIAIGALSMVGATRPELTRFELTEVCKMYLAFLYLANNIRDVKKMRVFVAFIIVGLFLEALVGFAQHRYGEPFWPTAMGGPPRIESRISGTWVSYNDFAWCLDFSLPLALSLLFSGIRSHWKLLCGAGLTLGGGALLWSNSRGGWISFAIAAVFVTVFVFGKIRGKWGLVKTVISIMMVCVLISPIYPRLSLKLYDRLEGDDRGSAESRLPQFEVAFNIIRDNPITGVGLNNYTEVMMRYDTTKEGLKEITHYAVHNIFLQMTAEMGIFGISAFLWLIAAIFVYGIRRSAVLDKYVSYAVVGLLGGIIAFLFHGIVDTATLGNKLFMFLWVFAGIIFSTKYMTKQSHQATAE